MLASSSSADADPEQPVQGNFYLCQTRSGERTPFWLPVPFHPLLARAGFQRLLDDMCKGSMRQLLLQSAGCSRDDGQYIGVKIAWQLDSPCFMATVRAVNLSINDHGQRLLFED